MSVAKQALKVLSSGSPDEKTRAAFDLASNWRDSPQLGSAIDHLPERPARPSEPTLVAPRKIVRKGLGSVEGRVRLLHAVAHIEFNAIDLSADLICRFGHSALIDDGDRVGFIEDWVGVCDDEARHFNLIQNRLKSLGAQYGDYGAHDGLWEAAQSTQNDLSARLAIAPMVLEARGLDVTPGMIVKLENVGDQESANILKTILTDEIGHVAIGTKWFKYVCARQNRAPEETFTHLVEQYFHGRLKPPFNVKARSDAGMSQEFYAPTAKSDLNRHNLCTERIVNRKLT